MVQRAPQNAEKRPMATSKRGTHHNRRVLAWGNPDGRTWYSFGEAAGREYDASIRPRRLRTATIDAPTTKATQEATRLIDAACSPVSAPESGWEVVSGLDLLLGPGPTMRRDFGFFFL